MRIIKSVYWTRPRSCAVDGDYIFECLGCRRTELISVGSIDEAVAKGIVFNAAHQACKKLVADPYGNRTTNRAPEAREERTA